MFTFILSSLKIISALARIFTKNSLECSYFSPILALVMVYTF